MSENYKVYEATTPTALFRFSQDPLIYDVIQITFRRGPNKLIKRIDNGVLPEGITINDKLMSVTLSQEETLILGSGIMRVQIRAKRSGGKVKASSKFRIRIDSSLDKEIL